MPAEEIVARDRIRIARLTGSAVVGLDVLPGSVANRDYRVGAADGRQLIAKLGPADELVAEAWACRRLFGLDVPVPPIVALELDGAGRGLLIMEFLPGAPSDDPTVLQRAGRIFRVVHRQQLPGWGPLVVDGPEPEGEARGRFESWSDAVYGQLGGLPDLVAAGILDVAVAEQARSQVARPEVLDYDGPGVLLHHDLKRAHLFAEERPDGPRLSGVIDWGDAGVGDPRADLARLSMAGPAVLVVFCDGYGLTLTPDLATVLARYRILWNLAALSYEHRAGGDWFDAYRTGLVTDLRWLARTDRTARLTWPVP